MPIVFQCQYCAREYRVADTNAGKRFACKQCGQPVLVPGPSADEPQPAAAPARAPGAAGPGVPRPRADQQPAIAAEPTGAQARAMRPRDAQPSIAAEPMPGPMHGGPTHAPMHGANPYGAAPQAAGPMKRKPNFIFLGGAGAMLLGFFLPWISIDAGFIKFSWSGYEIPSMMNKAVEAAVNFVEGFSDGQDSPELEKIRSLKTRVLFTYSLFLIPLLSIAGSVEELTSAPKGRNRWWARALTAAAPLIAIITVIIAFSGLTDPSGSDTPTRETTSSDGPSIFEFIGVGIYLSFAGFVAATVGIFVVPKPMPARAPMMPRSRQPMGGPRPGMVGPQGAAPGMQPGMPPQGPQPMAPRPGGPQPARPGAPRPGARPPLPRGPGRPPQ